MEGIFNTEKSRGEQRKAEVFTTKSKRVKEEKELDSSLRWNDGGYDDQV